MDPAAAVHGKWKTPIAIARVRTRVISADLIPLSLKTVRQSRKRIIGDTATSAESTEALRGS